MSTLRSRTSTSNNKRARFVKEKHKLEPISLREHVLYVDDEPALRETVPPILTNAGFAVTSAATVSEALSIINLQTFDVLISDLNIGEPGDGFTVVSAMRRSQPKCHTLILTGYPDFDAALESIRQQADGFIIKPAQPERLIETVRQQLRQPRRHLHHGHERLASLLRANKQLLIQNWLDSAEKDGLLRVVGMSENERLDHLPVLLDELIHILESKIHEVGYASSLVQQDLGPVLRHLQERTVRRAAQHGNMRKRQGYTLDMLFRESRLAQAVIFQMLYEHLLELEMSWVIPDLTVMSDVIGLLVAKSVETYSEAKSS